MLDKEKESLLKDILELELEFFTSMNVEESVPEKALPALKRMRWMTYSVLSEETLTLLLENLRAAKAAERNTMIEKYALIDGLIEPIQENPLIEKIVSQEVLWMDEVAERYPQLVQNHENNKDLFARYMSCELQSWQPEGLASYWRDINAALSQGRNLAEERYDNLYMSLGKGSMRDYSRELKGC